MARRMLIDASHPEETRVVVVDGTRLEEFDFETASRKPLKGNIYLAKVIRIEPSLQAAFVEYGGNRHSFLAFSEIHADYYQIPVADRERLIAEQQRMHAEADDEPELRSTKVDRTDIEEARAERVEESEAVVSAEGDAFPDATPAPEIEAAPAEPMAAAQPAEMPVDRIDGPVEEAPAESEIAAEATEAVAESEAGPAEAPQPEVTVETLGGDDSGELRETRERRRRHPVRQYKIQEVIKRRQILLVQVVKEERGNKGAALTTFLSLAGRYCVLMPNAGRGGGISRKISNPADRKRMKEMLSQLEVPQGMGVILRTAGLERSNIDIKRDYEYLSRLWDSIRELTMRSTAPALIYEEGDLIKRSLRDVYDTDIAQVLVEARRASRPRPSSCASWCRTRPARSSSTTSRSPSSTATRWRRSSTPCTRRPCSCARAATSSSTRPRRWSPSTSTRAAPPRSATSRRPRSAPTSRPPRKSQDKCACAIWPA